MKKRLLRVAIIIVAIVLVLLIVVEFIPRHFDSVKNTSVSGSNSWMADIPDETSLGDMSIPGVHDAGARNVRLALFSKCQDLTTKELLDAGFRYLDIRLGVEMVCGEPGLSIYHGFTNCLTGNTIFSGHLYLDNIIEECKAFLAENPSETILFVVKKEHGDETVKEFEEILSGYTDSDLWLLTDTIPTLGEARGKIVLFRRYEDEAGLEKKAGIYLSWSQQKDNSDTTLTYETVDEGGFTAFVQDRYKFSVDDKWPCFTNTLKEADELTKNGVLINFLSTNGTPAYGHPYKYAKKLNALFSDFDITVDNAGWVIVDFGNAELAKKIYELNK